MFYIYLGKYHCPVTYKVFNANTNIVAIKTTGNVYCLDVSTICMLFNRELQFQLGDYYSQACILFEFSHLFRVT